MMPDIKPPQGMLDAVHNALASYPVASITGHGAEISCNAALRWLNQALEDMIKDDPYKNDNYFRSETINENAVRGGFNKAIREVQRIFTKPPFDPSLSGVLSGRTFSQEQADAIKDYIQKSVHPRYKE